MIKYLCDKCEKDISESSACNVSVDGRKMALCVGCHRKLILMRKEVDRRFLRGEDLEFTPPEEPQHMTAVGFSSHDCEAWYKCPECGKEYGSWGFFHKKLLPKTVFKCECCGTQLIVPE